MITKTDGAFWDDLAEDLQDPEFRHHYLLESTRIAAVDRIIDELDQVRASAGISKADLARAIERSPESLRRLLTARSVNPQLGVVVEMAAALGYRVTLERMNDRERKQIAEPLRRLVRA